MVIDAQGVPRLAVSGWQETSNTTLEDLLRYYLPHGLRHVLCTDISRDGRLTGPNSELYQGVLKLFPALQLQASGGVSSLEDLRKLRTTGVAGAIIGRALYENKFTLTEALAC